MISKNMCRTTQKALCFQPNFTDFLKNYNSSAHAGMSSRKVLRNSKIITNGNAMCANRQNPHANKEWSGADE